MTKLRGDILTFARLRSGGRNDWNTESAVVFSKYDNKN